MIKRGEIYLVNFNPSRGSEQSGIRPALVIQNDIGNKYSDTTIILAISGNTKNNPTSIEIKPNKENNLSKKSCVKTSQILTISKERLIKKIGILNKEEISKINESIIISLNL